MTVITMKRMRLIPIDWSRCWRVVLITEKLIIDSHRKDTSHCHSLDPYARKDLARKRNYYSSMASRVTFRSQLVPKAHERHPSHATYGTYFGASSSYSRDSTFGAIAIPKYPGATFQRCMMAIFHDMIEKTMEEVDIIKKAENISAKMTKKTELGMEKEYGALNSQGSNITCHSHPPKISKSESLLKNSVGCNLTICMGLGDASKSPPILRHYLVSCLLRSEVAQSCLWTVFVTGAVWRSTREMSLPKCLEGLRSSCTSEEHTLVNKAQDCVRTRVVRKIMKRGDSIQIMHFAVSDFVFITLMSDLRLNSCLFGEVLAERATATGSGETNCGGGFENDKTIREQDFIVFPVDGGT
ncbi:hypothetical protein Tco_1336865 [Tanacetum coccineum]